MIKVHMNLYYCVNLCEVLFKSVLFQPLKYSQEGSILLEDVIPPPPRPHHPYPSRDCSTRNSLDVSLTLSTSEEPRLQMYRNQNESTYLQGKT